ncbi:glycosyltransferase family 2 protein [Fulvimarina sp. MAC3]|uniref:glycosyltransferase family 2 protein n=1 Tax=Fulvimarina sp. MAC3 TaxID=3148887 RepID=UPI0031FC62A2
MTETLSISAIVVTYFTGKILEDCLASLNACPEICEVILVDNGSGPLERDIIERQKSLNDRLTWISHQGNIGFAIACNLGARSATGSHLLFVNPDCVVPGGAAAAVAEIVGAEGGDWCATPRLVDERGLEQVGARRNEPTPSRCIVEALATVLSDRVVPAHLRINLNAEPLPTEPIKVDAISGSFMLMPRETFADVGGFDERYFLHFEDLDLCLRLRQMGARLVFVPSVDVVHVRGTSRVTPLVVERLKGRGLWIYFKTFYAKTWPWPTLRLVWLAIYGSLLTRGFIRTLIARMFGKTDKGCSHGMA